MSDLVLDPVLETFAAEAELSWTPLPDGGVAVGESEVALHVRRADGAYEVERVSRGRPAGLQLVTTERDAVDRFVADWIGAAWREVHRLPRLDTAAGPTTHAGSVEPEVVLDADGWRASLHWTVDGRRVTASGLNRSSAARLGAALAHPLDALVAAYRDPEGRPLFRPAGR